MTSKLAGVVAVVLIAMVLGAASGDGCGDTGGGKDTGIDKSGGPGAQSAKQKPVDFKPRTFSGNGETNIGTIKVPGDAVFEWTNADSSGFRQFLAYDADFQLSVSSEAQSGKSVMPAGTYSNIDVSGGDWTVKIAPSP